MEVAIACLLGALAMCGAGMQIEQWIDASRRRKAAERQRQAAAVTAILHDPAVAISAYAQAQNAAASTLSAAQARASLGLGSPQLLRGAGGCLNQNNTFSFIGRHGAMATWQAGVGASWEPDLAPPDKAFSTEFGYRYWRWDHMRQVLYSPVQLTPWNGPELRCETWDESEVVRGVAGIHAHLVPQDWRTPRPTNTICSYHASADEYVVASEVWGIVERFGRYVLGTEGWRAEWVMIRKLIAPNEEVGMALERAFPDVEVIYGGTEDGDR